MADRLRSSTRAGDVAGRLGVDEFVFLARDMAPEAAADFAESIIRRVAEQPFAIAVGKRVRRQAQGSALHPLKAEP